MARDYDTLDGTQASLESGPQLSRNSSRSSDNLLPRSPPVDKCKFILIGFTILGITTLVPWNFFITATDYWMYKFRNVTQTDPDPEARTPLQTFFESYLSIAVNFPMLVAMVLTALYGSSISQKLLLRVPLLVMLSVFILTTVFAVINTDNFQYFFFALMIIMVILLGLFSAVFQAALFGYTSNFPSHCMFAMVNGQSVAGLLAAALQVLSLSLDCGPIVNGLSYFAVSTLFLIFTIIYHRLMDNDYTRYYLGSDAQDDKNQRPAQGILESTSQLKLAFRECWKEALVVLLIFTATLSVFPAICVLVTPKHPNTSFLTGKYFGPIVTFWLFNSADLAGRLCSTYLPFPHGKSNSLVGLALIRIIFPVMILFCNVQPRLYTTPFFTNDIIYPILMTGMGLTNGYIFSSAMVLASSEAHDSRRELTGFIMATSLGVGLTLGSINSNFLLRII